MLVLTVFEGRRHGTQTNLLIAVRVNLTNEPTAYTAFTDTIVYCNATTVLCPGHIAIGNVSRSVGRSLTESHPKKPLGS